MIWIYIHHGVFFERTLLFHCYPTFVSFLLIPFHGWMEYGSVTNLVSHHSFFDFVVVILCRVSPLFPLSRTTSLHRIYTSVFHFETNLKSPNIIPYHSGHGHTCHYLSLVSRGVMGLRVSSLHTITRGCNTVLLVW